jgi:RimJ/RimL family protein N-acetyltransferase
VALTAPLIQTERLSLSCPAAADHAGLLDLMASAAVRRYLGGHPTNATEEFNRLCRNAGSWLLYGYGTFVVRARGTDDFLGLCGVFHSWRSFGKGMTDTPEIGWIFAEKAWGKGIATEAAGAALCWFDREHGPRRIGCMIDEPNLPSFKVAAKLGFVRYGSHDEGTGPVILLERK